MPRLEPDRSSTHRDASPASPAGSCSAGRRRRPARRWPGWNLATRNGTLKPLPGLTMDASGNDCMTTSPDAVRGAAGASRQWASRRTASPTTTGCARAVAEHASPSLKQSLRSRLRDHENGRIVHGVVNGAARRCAQSLGSVTDGGFRRPLVIVAVRWVPIANRLQPGARMTQMPPAPQHGRYVGVGIYGPDKQWQRLVLASRVTDEALAKQIDDQVIIVVADSTTGELRACGDLTGYCIGMNPWTKPLLGAQISPIRLTSHVDPDDPNLTVEVGPLRPHRHRPASNPHAPPAAGPD